jgi:hypothetical protein
LATAMIVPMRGEPYLTRRSERVQPGLVFSLVHAISAAA